MNVKLTKEGADAIQAIKRAEIKIITIVQEPNMPGWGYELLKAAERLVEAWQPLCTQGASDGDKR